VINGDVMTKIRPTLDGKGYEVVPTGPGDSHEDRLGLFEAFLRGILQNPNVEVIINMGNHEFMHLREFMNFIRRMRAAFPDRFFVTTNVQVGGGLAGLVQSSVDRHGITFVGYCTADIFGTDLHYAAARRDGYFVAKPGGKKANCAAHNERFKGTLKSVNTPAVVILSHENRKTTARYVEPLMHSFPPCVKEKDLVLGHDHSDCRPNQKSKRPYGIFRKQRNKVTIPKSTALGTPVDVSFSEADLVIAPRPFGESMEAFDFELL
jgi:hypothetical protein